MRDQKGRIDILFANAGRHMGIRPIGQISEPHFDKKSGQRQRAFVQCPKGFFLDSGRGRWFGSLGCFGRLLQGVGDVDRLQGKQDGRALVCPHLDGRSKEAQNPRRRRQSPDQ